MRSVQRGGWKLLVVGIAITAASAFGTLAPDHVSVASAAMPAAPLSPTDESKVPHYFGPYPNWANSPQVLADAIVTITGGGGTGRRGDRHGRPEDGRHLGDHRHQPGQRLHVAPTSRSRAAA